MEKELIIRWLNDKTGIITIGNTFVLYQDQFGHIDKYIGNSLSDIISRYWLDGMVNSSMFSDEEKAYLKSLCSCEVANCDFTTL